MTILSLDAKITQIARALEQARIPHAFGGAIALAYYGAPRGTENIDLNVFAKVEHSGSCLEALGKLGIEQPPESRHSDNDQRMLFWEHTAIHVFFSYDPFHGSCEARARNVPFGDGAIWILSAEDIAIFKIVYDRPRDRAEVREVLLCMGERLDVRYTLAWLERLLGCDDSRTVAFRQAAAELVPARFA